MSPYKHYRDHSYVTQEDGRLAQFTWDSDKPDEGWVFNCLRDSQHFIILEGDAQVDKFAQLLLDSTLEKNAARLEARRAEYAKRPKLSPAEQQAAFSRWVFPVIEAVNFAPVLPNLVAVQPMSATSTGSDSVFKLELAPSVPDPKPTVGEDEVLHEYVYGGILSERGGFFVTKKDQPERVLRYLQTWLS